MPSTGAGWSRGLCLGACVVLLLASSMAVGSPGPRPRPFLALVTDEISRGDASPTTPLPGDRPLTLTLSLASPHADALAERLAAVADPASPGFHRFMSYGEYVSAFGASPASVADLEAYFAAHGGHAFTATPDRLGLSFEISAGGAASALGVRFVSLGSPAGPGFTALGQPQLPPALAGFVESIHGLSSPSPSVPVLHPPPVAPVRVPRHGLGQFVIDGASGVNEPWYVGTDFASAYHVSALFPPSTAVPNATFPTGRAVATLLMSGYNDSSNVDLPPFDPVVIQAYFNDTLPAGWPQPNVAGVPVTVAGLTPPAPGYFRGLNDTTDNAVENSLDLEMAGSLAPGAQLVNFYFSGSLVGSKSLNPTVAQLADYFAQDLAAALAHDYAPARLTVVSGSFGLPDLNDSLWNAQLAAAALTGVTVLSASGDQGNAPNDVSGRFQGQWPSWPATAAFNTSGTVAVGGTSVTTTGTPTATYNGNGSLNLSYDPTVTDVASEDAWYNVLAGYGNVSGTEGGASTLIPEPYWQLHSAAQPNIVNATVQQGAGTLGRAEPDVALPANETVAYVARDAGGVYFEVLQGTSISAPLFAGMLASLSAVAGHPFGYLAPELYRIASYYENHSGDPTNPFLDVTSGRNFEFASGPGWDAATGWGGVDAPRFLAADANPSVSGYVYTGPTPGLPPPLAINGGTLSVWILVLIGISVSCAVVLVLVALRPRHPPVTGYPPHVYQYQYGAPPPPPSYAWAPPPPGPGPLPGPPPHSFLCPYCGAPRPAEPVRCPYCGRL